MFDIKEQLKNLPNKPGVYIMKDKEKNIIYIGKAKVLKNRVRQYFQASHSDSPKVKSMVANIEEFEYIVTDSELEALVLECNLIKKHKPRYNILLKDDKHYPYIKITLNEDYPRLLFTRKILKDGSKYFGPYSSAPAVRETIDIIKKIFAVRGCDKVLICGAAKGRSCLNYHMKQCLAPCQGIIDKEAYNRIIDDVISFLSGKHEALIKKLTRDMSIASSNMEFERAASLRDKINSINIIAQRQKIISTSFSDQDIIAFAADDRLICIQIFFVRGGKLIGRENFIVDNVLQTENGEVLSTFIKQFYNDAPYVPKEIVLKYDVYDAELIEAWLSEKRGSKVSIKVPQKGEKLKLVSMVEQNANEVLSQHNLKIKNDEEFQDAALSGLKDLLGLEGLPRRIEGYDISNTGGSENVGVMVVFKNGRPYNKDYRKFKIKSVLGANDYESMKELIYRRLRYIQKVNIEEQSAGSDKRNSGFNELPDLILLDGGKGHVSVIKSVLSEMGLSIPVFGMVKDTRHKTRDITDEKADMGLKANSSTFKLITNIQDEVHRSAVMYHRKLRFDKNVKSELMEISGIGEVRRRNLMMHFKTIDEIKSADIEQLLCVEGMNKTAAERVYKYFNK